MNAIEGVRFEPLRHGISLPLPVLTDDIFKRHRTEIVEAAVQCSLFPETTAPKKFKNAGHFLKSISDDDGEELRGFIHSIEHLLLHYFYIPKHYEWISECSYYYNSLLQELKSEFDDDAIVVSKYRSICWKVNRIHLCIENSLNGKQGHVRLNLMGKRVFQCTRGVACLDCDLLPNQVGIPASIARELSSIVPKQSHADIIWEVWCSEKQKLVPIAYSVYKTPFDVPVGTIIRRPLKDGDIVLLNRQPSLLPQNLLAQRVIICPDSSGYVIRVNIAVTECLGADFDGDEVNVFVPPNNDCAMRLLEKASVVSQQNQTPSGESKWAFTQDLCLGSFLLGLSKPNEWTPENYLRTERLAYTRLTQDGYSVTTRELLQPCGGRWGTIIKSGSKGSQRNLDAMRDSLGSMAYNGGVVPPIPMRDSSQDGTLLGSYLTGLSIPEFIQHAMVAREAAATTSILTAETGYCGRLLFRATEDCKNEASTGRILMRIAGAVGEVLTQMQLSNFHHTGTRTQCGFNQILSWLRGRPGGPKQKQLFDEEHNIVFSAEFTILSDKNSIFAPRFLCELIQEPDKLPRSISANASKGNCDAYENVRVDRSSILGREMWKWCVKYGTSEGAHQRVLNQVYKLWSATHKVIPSDPTLVPLDERVDAYCHYFVNSDLGKLPETWLKMLVEHLVNAGEGIINITRHGNAYKQREFLARGAMECCSEQYKGAILKQELDTLQNPSSWLTCSLEMMN